MRIVSKSTKETKNFARKFAENIEDGKQKQAVILALEGELGSGKTTFAQGFLGYFGVKKANSPTFVIMKKYSPAKIFTKNLSGQSFYLYHIDCYRIRSSRDLLELGFSEITDDSHNIILIEWAERVSDLLPKDTIRISFKHKSEKERVIEIFNFDAFLL